MNTEEQSAKQIPLTFFYLYNTSDKNIRAALEEFVSLGQKNLVLTDGIFRQIIANPERYRYFRNLLNDMGMRFVDSHSVYGVHEDLCCVDPWFRPAKLHLHERTIEIASTFGVETITIHMGKYLDHSIPLRTYIDECLRTLDYLLPLAQKAGITICIENVWYQTSSADALLVAIDHFKSDSLGVCFDAGHFNIMSGRFKDPLNRMWRTHPFCEPKWDSEILNKLYPHITICHIHDNDGLVDKHLIPGRGNAEWDKIMPKLLSAPKLKSVQCEAAPVAATGYTIKEAVTKMRELTGQQ